MGILIAAPFHIHAQIEHSHTQTKIHTQSERERGIFPRERGREETAKKGEESGAVVVGLSEPAETEGGVRERHRGGETHKHTHSHSERRERERERKLYLGGATGRGSCAAVEQNTGGGEMHVGFTQP